MLTNSRIILHCLNYTVNDKTIISEFDFCFLPEKYGIVGRNGIGKSTLLKLIAGELLPSSGSIKITGKITYFSQEILQTPLASVAEMLDVAEKMQALQRINQGSVDEQDYTLVADDWDLAEKIQRQLAAFNLSDITTDRLISSLSGGERARLLLAKAFLAQADILILDEPTNNLDSGSRQALYQAIWEWKRGLIIVSHDRELLSFMDNIVEISPLGVQLYGGNYADYVERKQIERNAAEQTLQAAAQLRSQAKIVTQERRERHEQAKAKGRLARKNEIAKVGILKSRIAFDSAKGRSERTQRKINLQSQRKLTQVNSVVDEARAKIEATRELNIDLSNTQIPNGKMILAIKNLSFNYPRQQKPLIDNFSLSIQGPDRIALLGDNGSGKTTLIKLILGELSPDKGSLNLGSEQVNYLDQALKIIQPNLSVLENFLRINPDIREVDARFHLADFLFRNDAVFTRGCQLSSGERLRAALACILMSLTPPQLLILDEPTNHLDLPAIATIESALQKYQGALIVVSHDMSFLQNIEIRRMVALR